MQYLMSESAQISSQYPKWGILTAVFIAFTMAFLIPLRATSLFSASLSGAFTGGRTVFAEGETAGFEMLGVGAKNTTIIVLKTGVSGKVTYSQRGGGFTDL